MAKEAVRNLSVSRLSTSRHSARGDVKEGLPATARALGLTVQSWEVGDANGLKGCSLLKQQLPDGIFCPGGPGNGANLKRIAGFALKRRLPTMYRRRKLTRPAGSCTMARTSRIGTGGSQGTLIEA